MDLRGAVALVTGGNGGLGQRICHALAREGARIAVVYARSRDDAERVARDLASRHQIDAGAFACDVTDGAAVDELVRQVTERFGRLDILVNDAAYNVSIPFDDLDGLTLEVWEKIMAINLTGPLRLMKAVAPVMKAQKRGRVVNIASVAGLGPTGSSIAYAVSKAGLIHLTRCFAVALAPETLVNCVAPGLLEGTRATANLRPEQIERSTASSLLKPAASSTDLVEDSFMDNYSKLFDLTGKRALVIGAAKGIGQAACFGLASHGAHVVCGDIDMANARETVSAIKAAGHSAEALHVDLSDAKSITDAAAGMEAPDV